MGDVLVLPRQGPGRPADQRPSILIVENEFVVALDTARALDGAGYRIIGMANRKADALRMAERDPPDAAVVDLYLADGLTGLATARELGERYGAACLLLTAFAERVAGDTSAALGVLGKPCPPEVLRDAAGYCLGLASGGRPPGGPPLGLRLLSGGRPA